MDCLFEVIERQRIVFVAGYKDERKKKKEKRKRKTFRGTVLESIETDNCRRKRQVEC